MRFIDGRNRHRASLDLGIEPSVREWEGDPDRLVSYVISTNLHRRHLSETQRGLIAGKLANLSNGSNQHQPRTEGRPIGLPSVSQPEAAVLMNVGLNTVKRAKVVLDCGVPELIKAVEEDKVSVSAVTSPHPASITTIPGTLRQIAAFADSLLRHR